MEGRGAATIYSIDTISVIPPPIPTSSAELPALKLKYKQTKKALERSQKDIASLETYLRSVNAEHVAVTALGEVVENYESGLYTRKLDDNVTKLEKQLVDLNKAVEVELKKLSGLTGTRTFVMLFCQKHLASFGARARQDNNSDLRQLKISGT